MIKRHPVLAYFVLTLVISWGSLLVIMGVGGILGTTAGPREREPLLYVGMLLGPCLAGLLLTRHVHGHFGLRGVLSRLCRWRVGAIWYAIAILTSPGLVAAILLPLVLFSPAFIPGMLTSSDKVALLVSGLVAGALVGTFEELGWTGFAIPQLRLRYGVPATGLIVGFIWGHVQGDDGLHDNRRRVLRARETPTSAHTGLDKRDGEQTVRRGLAQPHSQAGRVRACSQR